MERTDREAIDEFVAIAGVSEAVAIQKLQEHGGDLNSAVDAYFAESNENNVPVVHNVREPRHDPMQFDEMVHIGRREPEFSLLSPTGPLDRLFGTNNLRSIFRAPSFFPSREIDETNFHRSIFDRIPSFPGQEPFVSHPREVREIPIEVKDSNESSSRDRLAPTIVDVTGTEHDHGPEIRGTVTMEDDDFASENDMRWRSTQVDYASVNVVPAPSAETDYLDDDIDEQMLLAALEASRRDTEEKHSTKSYETDMDLDDPGAVLLEPGSYNSTAIKESPKCSTLQGSQPRSDPESSFILEDVEERPLVRQKTKTLSSMKTPKEDVECATRNFSSSTERVGSQHAIKEVSLPQEPLPDENNVVNILLRMPDGRRLGRRFHTTDKLKVVFDFIQICGGVHPENYKLAVSYPRRTFSEADGSLTLHEIGLTNKHEALYLEPV
ncbi:hypothetical protein QQ045_000467 [Rhodiola kirilowii]